MGRLIQIPIIFGVLAGSFWEAPALASEIAAGAAQALNFVYTRGGCDSVDEADARSAVLRARACGQTMSKSQFAGFTDIARIGNASAEDSFFAALAEQNARELECASRFSKAAAQDEAGLQKQIVGRLRVLREARQVWVQAMKELRADRVLAGRGCPATLDELADPNDSDKYKQLCRKAVTAKATFAAIQNSIPLIGEARIKEFTERFANGSEEVSNNTLETQISAAYSGAADTLHAQATKLQARAASKSGSTFNPEEKHSLLADPAVIERVVRGEPAILKAVACKADARYGRGHDALESTLSVGTLAFGGGALVTTKAIGWLPKLTETLYAARSAGQVSMIGLRVLQAGAVGGTVATAALASSRICRHSGWKQKASGAGQCVSAPTIEQMESEACVLAATLTALDVASILPASKIAMLMIPAWANKTAAPAQASFHAAENIAEIQNSDWGKWGRGGRGGFGLNGIEPVPLSRESKNFVRSVSRRANQEVTDALKIDHFLKEVGAHGSVRDFARRHPDSVEVETLLDMIKDVHDPNKIKREIGNLIAASEREGRRAFVETASNAVKAKALTSDEGLIAKQSEIDKLAEQFKKYVPERGQDTRFIEIVAEKGAHVDMPDGLYDLGNISFPSRVTFKSLFLKHSEPHAFGLNEVAKFRSIESQLLAAKTDADKLALLEQMKALGIVRKDRPTSVSLFQNQIDMAPDFFSDSSNFKSLSSNAAPSKDHVTAVSFESEFKVVGPDGKATYHPHRYRIAVCSAPEGEICATAGAQYKQGEVITFYPECGDFVLRAPSFLSLKKYYMNGTGAREYTLERVPCVD